jgi:sugar diacid utilization regulator
VLSLTPTTHGGQPWDAAPLPPWARAAAGDVDLEALREVVVQRDIAAAFVPYADDETFVEHLRASVQENLAALRAYLSGTLALGDIRLDRPLTFGNVQAQLRIPQTSLQRSYRVGFVAMWEAWMRAVWSAARELGVPREQAVAAVLGVTQRIFAYQDHVAYQVAEEFSRTEEALGRSRRQVRQGLIRGLLGDDPQVPTPADRVTIGYDLDWHHLALLLPRCAEADADRLLARLRAEKHVPQSLVHAVDMTSSVLWLGRPVPWRPAEVEDVTAFLRGAGLTACVSEPADGVGGLRESFRQTQAIERVRSASGPTDVPAVLTYRDVALEILLLHDPALARAFVREELGPLADGSAEAARLRETLEVSYRLASHVATAEQLAVHEHTVRNRLQKTEQLLGHPLAERRTEVQVALRLHRLVMAG